MEVLLNIIIIVIMIIAIVKQHDSENIESLQITIMLLCSALECLYCLAR